MEVALGLGFSSHEHFTRTFKETFGMTPEEIGVSHPCLEAENFESLVMDVLYKAEQYLFTTWLPSHNLQTEPFCAERYESHTPQTAKMEVWLKLI